MDSRIRENSAGRTLTSLATHQCTFDAALISVELALERCRGEPMNYKTCVWILVAAAGCVQHAAAQQDQALVQRFLNEAPPKWREYEGLAEKLQGQYHLSL